MRKREEASTRARILAAAERLFSHQGLEKATIRGIAAEAGVNIAAVNYHFGSKEALERETFRVLAARVNRDRLDRLERCLEEAGDRPPRLDDLVTALIGPYLDSKTGRPSLVPQLILLLSLPGASQKSKHAVGTAFDEVAARFVDAFGRALPGVPKAELWWRYDLAIGTIVYSVAKGAVSGRLARLSGGIADTARHSDLLQHLISFVTAALRGESTGNVLPMRRQARGAKR